MKNVSNADFNESIKEGVVIVNVGASWCPDCKHIEPIMEALAKDYESKIKFLKVDFNKDEQLKDTLQIRRIPTLIFYKDGNEVGERLIEPKSQVAIEEVIKKILN